MTEDIQPGTTEHDDTDELDVENTVGEGEDTAPDFQTRPVGPGPEGATRPGGSRRQ